MNESKPISENPAASAPAAVAAHGSARPKLGRFWFAMRLLEVRLRFIALLIGLGLVIRYWETIQNIWDRATRPKITVAANAGSDTEFYCPMDPSVIRDSLEPNGSIPKCPICGMPLSTRKKGSPMVLPPGVVGRVSLTPDRIRMAGIRTAEIAIRPMTRDIRSVGVVAYNQSKQSQIVSRVGGYLEELFVDKVFAQVHAGDPLAEIYSPELSTAIQELKIANAATNKSLAAIAREKIRLLGIEDREIDQLVTAGESSHRVIVRSPAAGYVIRKEVQQGASISAGQTLFEVADLSSVWIEADIFERDIGLLREGQRIEATLEAYPEQTFVGSVALIYPELQSATRTNRVRFEVDNPELLLRAGMFATITLRTPLQEVEPFATVLALRNQTPSDSSDAIARQSVCPVTGAKLGSMGDPVPVTVNERTVYLCCSGCTDAMQRNPDYYLARIDTVSDEGVLSVPESAVIDTGEQKIVYIEREGGMFEGVEVVLGPRANGFYSVINGLLPGDRVAMAGAFLIDAETRLNPAASAAYFGASGGPAANGASPTPEKNSSVPKDSSTDKSMPDSNKGQFLDPLTADELQNISQLGPEDQELARSQKFCPVADSHLGSMGVPVRIELEGEVVFLCCDGCVETAKSDPAATVAKVKEWRDLHHKANQ